MIYYAVSALEPSTHRFAVTLTLAAPAAAQRLSLPVWIPGSYLVREFARHLSGFGAVQGARPVRMEALDKATWLAHCEAGEPLMVRYGVHAADASVRAAFLDAARGFFNGTSLLLRVEGREAEPHRLEIGGLPAGWRVATTLRPLEVDANGLGSYRADSYDELVDHPVELGSFWRGAFEARGVPHAYVVAGALPDFDAERLLTDARRVCEAAIDFWHPAGVPPFDRYLFLHNLVDEGHGGLEHRTSTALISPRREMPQRGRSDTTDGYVNLLGLVSHEYFHAWNVKRMRPSEFARYDYGAENYTRLLWFFEGFTSYYDDLLLRRAGLIDAARYLRLVARTLSGVLATPGRKVQSVAEASFDAWIKYYRADENTPNATISYYAKGALIALALDLTLRSEGRGTLDDVMRRLWNASAGGPIDEAAIAAALAAVGGRSYAPELAAWVHGTDELPLQALLAGAGVEWTTEAATLAQRLGVRVAESALTGIKVQTVLRGGVAEAAGLAPGDELIAIDGWRLRRLDDALRVLVPGQEATLLAARDQRLLSLGVCLPEAGAAVCEPPGAIALTLATDAAPSALALRQAWLGA